MSHPRGNGVLDGNGGNGIVCGEANSQTAELLDLYEARTKYQLAVDSDALSQFGTFDPNDDPNQFSAAVPDPVRNAGTIVSRIGKFDPDKAYSYTQLLSSFCDHIDTSNPDMVEWPINDSGPVNLPPGCRLEHAILQFQHPTRYYLNSRLWAGCYRKAGLFSGADRTALLIHELVYRDLWDHGAVDSEKARYIVGVFVSKDFPTMSQAAYDKLMDDAGFNTYRLSFAAKGHAVDLVMSTKHQNYEQASNYCKSLGPGFNLIKPDELTSLLVPESDVKARQDFSDATGIDIQDVPVLATYDGWTHAPIANATHLNSGVFWIDSQVGEAPQYAVLNDYQTGFTTSAQLYPTQTWSPFCIRGGESLLGLVQTQR